MPQGKYKFSASMSVSLFSRLPLQIDETPLTGGVGDQHQGTKFYPGVAVGNTVSIIGNFEELEMARKYIEIFYKAVNIQTYTGSYSGKNYNIKLLYKFNDQGRN